MWVRGLKQNYIARTADTLSSHPMWVRGLKHVLTKFLAVVVVAPYVGAWIETVLNLYKKPLNMSHPMWVRGLKRRIWQGMKIKSVSHPMWVRGLKPYADKLARAISESHPMWVRGLKLLI